MFGILRFEDIWLLRGARSGVEVAFEFSLTNLSARPSLHDVLGFSTRLSVDDTPHFSRRS